MTIKTIKGRKFLVTENPKTLLVEIYPLLTSYTATTDWTTGKVEDEILLLCYEASVRALFKKVAEGLLEGKI